MEKKCVYTRQKHFKSMLDKMSGKSSIPAEALECVKSYMKDKGIEAHELTQSHVKTALREHSHKKWLPLYLDIYALIAQPYSSYIKEQVVLDHKEKNGICAICLEEDSNAVLKCKHTFHEDCIGEWNNVCNRAGRETRCPYCNSLLEIEQITCSITESHKQIIVNSVMEMFNEFMENWDKNPENTGRNMPSFNYLTHIFWNNAIQKNIQNLNN